MYSFFGSSGSPFFCFWRSGAVSCVCVSCDGESIFFLSVGFGLFLIQGM